jgi:hypothetical protein
MSTYGNEKQKSLAKRFLFILGLLLFTFYLAFGLAMIFWKDIPLTLSQNYRIAFGVLLIVYAFFRFIRLLQTKRN